MYITVKRKDSVSSILLFIFNVFLVERGITAIPLKKIFKILEPFQKNETAIRMGLSRDIQNKVLVNIKENGEVFYHLTETAIEGFKYWMKIMDYDHLKLQQQLKEWDGHWSILIISQPLEDIYEDFVSELKYSGYGLLGKNVWVSPYHRIEFIQQIAKKYYLGKGFNGFESRLTTGNPKDFALSIWPIEELQKRYQIFYDSLIQENEAMDLETFNGGGGLPFLYRWGLDYFEIVQSDPRLPLNLLSPDWPGLKAGKAFQNIREQILPQLKKFIDTILD